MARARRRRKAYRRPRDTTRDAQSTRGMTAFDGFRYRCMNLLSIRFFQCHDPFALEREASTGCDGVAIAGGDQRERVLLRRPFDERLSAQRPPQVLRQRRARANRVDAGFGTRLPRDAGDIARGEHLRMRDRLQPRRSPARIHARRWRDRPTFGHDGAEAPVAQTIASASTLPPPQSRRIPLSTRSTARPRCNVTPRCSSTRMKIARTLLLCEGRMLVGVA